MPVTVEQSSFASPWVSAIHTVASTARFQVMAGVDGEADPVAAAKTKFKHFWYEGAVTASDVVLVIVRGLDEDFSTFLALGEFLWSGPIKLRFLYVTPEAYRDNHEDAGHNFLNHLGKIRYEMQELIAADERLAYPNQYLNGRLALGQHGEGDPKDNNGVPFWSADLVYSWEGQ